MLIRAEGSALIRKGLEGFKSLRAKGCLLVGDPAYDRRFGFQNPPSLRVAEVPPEFALCQALEGPVPSGLATHHPAFFTPA